LDIQAEQHGPGQPYQELYEAVADLKRRHGLHQSAVRPGDGLSLRRDGQREVVQDLVKRYRELPAEHRRRLPALLNSLAQLEVVVGDLDDGQRDFLEVARLAAEPPEQAEAHHNAYRAALERQDWDVALVSLRRACAADAATFAPFPLDRYDPVRVLGAGGFGVSFLCQGPGGGRVVVLALRPDGLERGADAVFDEMRVVREVDHPALARVLEWGQVGEGVGRPFLVREYVEGTTLAEYVARHGPLSPEEWLRLCWPLARALQALHGRAVLHRGLRPGAVMLRRDKGPGGVRWRVRLIDVGLSLNRALIHASASHPAARARTALGRSVVRAAPYLAPEVLGRPKGQVWVGPHSDVYGFGRLCAFALTGRPDPDAGDRQPLGAGWKELLEDCTAWVCRRRPADVGAVVERLGSLPGAGEVVAGLEKELHEAAVAEYTALVEAEPTRADAWLGRAGARFRQGDYAGSAEDCTKAVELGAADAGVYRRRALARWRARDLDGALADYTEALRLGPRDVEALVNRGLVQAQRGEHDRAIADFTEALRINPRDDAVLFHRANSYYLKVDLAGAIDDYTAVARLNPRHAWALGNRGKAYAMRGEHARAIADFGRVLQLDPHNARALADRATSYNDLDRREDAVADLTEALRLEPTPELYIDRALTYAALGNTDAAVADFTEALALDPGNAAAHLLRGNVRADRGELDEAIADFTEALKAEPGMTTACYNRANAHARRQDYDRALADYAHALEIDPEYSAAYFNRGNVYCERGAWGQAVADYTRVLELTPDDPAAYTNRGNAHAALGDLDRALADYTEALAREPDDAPTLCNRANTYARRGDADRALADYSEALRLDPGNARIHSARGNLHAGRGDQDKALADYSEAVRAEPGFARAWNNRGNLRVSRGDLDGAVADFTEAIRLEPGAVPAWYSRGNAHAARGDHAAAVADFTEVLRLEPGHAGALNNRANSWVRLGEDDQALADFAASVAADPTSSLPWYNRAHLRARRGEYAGALADYGEAIRLDPSDLAGYHSRGRLHALMGHWAEAVADNLEALRLRPGEPRTCNNLAWLWATCPQEGLRDGPRAVEHARIACEATGWQDSGCLDTLAAACAAAGDFAEAVGWQHKAMELAGEGEKAEYEGRLRLYESGQPYREAPRSGGS
jgi:tetratricopeptide (TPR) repeat protein